MCTSNRRPLAAATGCHATKLRSQVGTGASGCSRGLDQRDAQRRATLAGAATEALAGTLMMARYQSRPRGEVVCCGKTAHVSADLSDHNLGYGAADAGNGVQSRHGLGA